jgi:4-oxalocrotonate tautomerase
MPFVNVKLVDGVFTSTQKNELAKALTDVIVKFEWSEAFREVVWMINEELHTDGWHIGGRPFERPCSLLNGMKRAKEAFESIYGTPSTREGAFTRGAAANPITSPRRRGWMRGQVGTVPGFTVFRHRRGVI